MLRLSKHTLPLASLCGASVIALVFACGDVTGDPTPLNDMTSVDQTFPAPTVTAVSPTSAVNNVATPLTITGTGFRSGATVTVGGQPCSSATVVSATSITCTAPGKAGSCGYQDIIVTHPDDKKSGTGSQLFSYSASGVGWAAPVDYPVGSYPRRVVAADVNGDGKTDLASVNQIGHSITVRLGAGDGTFPMAQSTNYPLGAPTTPNDLLVADLNGDGKPDLATVNSGGTGTVTIFLNSGTSFSSRVIATSSGGFSGGVSIAAGDISGDGKLDLAVSSQTLANVLPLIGDGTGAFTPGSVRTVGGLTSELALADMDGDGKVDIVTANYSNNNVSICINQGGSLFKLCGSTDASTRPYGLFVTDVKGV